MPEHFPTPVEALIDFIGIALNATSDEEAESVGPVIDLLVGMMDPVDVELCRIEALARLTMNGDIGYESLSEYSSE